MKIFSVKFLERCKTKRSISLVRIRVVVLMAVIVLGLAGCFRAVNLNSTAIESSNEDDIVVSTKDGRRVRFNSRKYCLDSDENGRQGIRGTGKVFRQGESQFKTFEGIIPIEDMERISTSERTSMFYVSIAATALAIGFALWLKFTLNGRGFGG